MTLRPYASAAYPVILNNVKDPELARDSSTGRHRAPSGILPYAALWSG
jgi:hypothetical protein